MTETAAQWITPFAVQLIPGGLMIIGMMFVPESPRYVCRFSAGPCNDPHLTPLVQMARSLPITRRCF